MCRRCDYMPRCKLRRHAMQVLKTNVIVTDNCVEHEPAKELTTWQ